jgi:sialidase-1
MLYIKFNNAIMNNKLSGCKIILRLLLMSFLSIFLSCGTKTQNSNIENDGPQTVLKLVPSDQNPRNSEGDFITLNDGRILFIYSHFTGGDGDHASAFLAGRYSNDEGITWSDKDIIFFSNESGLNLMSVSLIRLLNGDIALFYLKKNSLTDCRPVLRISKDECETWGEEIQCIRDRIGYFVMNNDRVIQLKTGRIILPLSQHAAPDMEWSNTGRIQTYYSDDNGASWKAGSLVANPDGVTLQEPGVVALKDGRILMFMRNNSGFQYISYSSDQGESWSPAEPSGIKSPISPASIERIPATGDLLLVWNNNGGENKAIAGKRTPFNIGISKDEGKTWQIIRTLADDPDGWYCYTAIEFTGDHVLLGHCAGNSKENNGLAVTHISRINLDWIYGRH